MASEEKSTPDRFPTTPGAPGNGDLSGALVRAIFDLNGAVGELRQALKTLTSQSQSQAQTLSEIRDQIHTAKTVVWIAGIALGFIGAAGVYLLDKILDLVLKQFGG